MKRAGSINSRMTGRIAAMVLTVTFTFFLSSCEKLDFKGSPPLPITKYDTVNASIKQNASFGDSVLSFSPICTSQITTDAAHASTSKLTTDADGNAFYQYVPSKDYSGKETIVIAMTGAQNKGSNINKEGKETHITTIYITVEAK